MRIDKIIVGNRVLLQSGESVKEVAQVKGVILDNKDFTKDKVIVKLSNGDTSLVSPEYILKDFEV